LKNRLDAGKHPRLWHAAAMTDATSSLTPLGQALQQLRAGSLDVAAFSALARGQSALLAALPPAFPQVLHSLLDRLESSALFSEESCSFSQTELLDSLQQWLDHARARLGGEKPA
jgi:hypothetical protein